MRKVVKNTLLWAIEIIVGTLIMVVVLIMNKDNTSQFSDPVSPDEPIPIGKTLVLRSDSNGNPTMTLTGDEATYRFEFLR